MFLTQVFLKVNRVLRTSLRALVRLRLMLRHVTLIRSDALQVHVYRLMCIFRHLLKKEHYDMCVPHAAEVIPSGKASHDISERPTIPIYVYFASSNGVAATSTGIISRRSMVLTLT